MKMITACLLFFSMTQTHAATMEADPTKAITITPQLTSEGIQFSFKIPPTLEMNDKGPYSITFENFKLTTENQKADKSVFNFEKKKANITGKKMDSKKSSTAKMALFICDSGKTWCRRVLREVSF